MGVALAVLVLAVISVGFVSLMFLPLAFIWLAFCVYKEPWKESAPQGVGEQATPEPLPPPTPEDPAVEKPRVMAAGRRRPL
jgi:hypothetical protein